MKTAVVDADVARFRDAIAARLGLVFDEHRVHSLIDVLNARLRATGLNAATYLATLNDLSRHSETSALAQALTVPETYFFRNADQFTALKEAVLPNVLGRAAGRPLSILCAGCATGEEPYSIAMLLHEFGVLLPGSIVAIDVNPEALRKARAGRYSSWALRETPAAMKQRWFRTAGREHILDEELRGRVRFEERNLAQPQPDLWRPDSYDIIFFRNVLMYFAADTTRHVLSRMTAALRPGGYLFLGHAETLRGLSNDFHLLHTHETFYYQRHADLAMPPPAAPQAPKAATEFINDARHSDDWVAAIHGASTRIEALTSAVVSPATAAAWNLDAAKQLLRDERFADALALLEDLPPESKRDSQVLLLRAVLQVHQGDMVAAEESCRQLLDLGDLNCGAHYLLALCREGAGDSAGAVHHYQVAIHLDPGFAMPHLHLGVLKRRTGDRIAAQRTLAQALPLLQRENASRLLLFGGGFKREALVALCEAELRAAVEGR